MTTKILALTDALGNLVRRVLMTSHRFNARAVYRAIDCVSQDGFYISSDCVSIS